MNERKDILVYIESNPDGSAVDASLGLLSAASGIAAKRGGRICALVIGGNCADAAASAAKYGAELVIEAEGEEYAVYSTEAYTAANVFFEHCAKCREIKRAKVAWSGAGFPSKRYMKLMSLRHAVSISRLE